MKKQIEQLAERFETLSPRAQSDVREILARYVEGKTGLDETHYALLDEGLIPMPSRCTMYNKPEETHEAEEKLKDLIREKVLGE